MRRKAEFSYRPNGCPNNRPYRCERVTDKTALGNLNPGEYYSKYDVEEIQRTFDVVTIIAA